MTWISQISTMRLHILILASSAVVFAAGVAAIYWALPNLVPEDKLRRAIAAQAATWSGGEFRLPVGAEISLGRGPAMKVENAEISGTFSGVEWQLDVASLEATFRLLPLLQGQVEIETLTLDAPHLRVQDRDDSDAAAFREPPLDAPDLPGPKGEVIATNASLTYDGPSGQRGGVEGIDLRMAAEADSTAVLFTGAFPAEKDRLHMRGRLEDPAAAFSGRGSEARLALWGAATADYAGTPPQPKPDVQGAAQENQVISELRRIAADVGLTGTGPLAIEGRIFATPRTLGIAGATMSLGGLFAEGDLTIVLAGEELPVEQLDGVVRGAVAAWREVAAAIRAGSWREAPVTLDWIAPLEITLAARLSYNRLAGSILEARHIRLQSIDGGARLEVVATGDLGSFRGELALGDMSGSAPPYVALNGQLEDIELASTGRVLQSLAPPPLVSPPKLPEGTLNAEFDVTSQGDTLGAMVAALDGTLSMEAGDGNLAGADMTLTLESLADGRVIMTEKDGPLIPTAGRTEFDTLKTRIEFAEGFARLADLRIRGGRYAIEMGGEVNLEVGEMNAEGRARLHRDGSGADEAPPLLTLPFGVGGTLAAPVVAAGVPSRDAQTGPRATADDVTR